MEGGARRVKKQTETNEECWKKPNGYSTNALRTRGGQRNSPTKKQIQRNQKPWGKYRQMSSYTLAVPISPSNAPPSVPLTTKIVKPKRYFRLEKVGLTQQ